MHQLMLEPAQNYELSNCRSCRNIDISGDGLQFLCITLWFQDRVAQTLPRLGRGHDLDDNFMPGGPSHSIHQNCASCAHSLRTHRAPTAHSKNGVMRPRGLWSSISSMQPWEHLVHIFCVSFYTLWQDARQQNVLTGSANTQCFYCALHALRGCPVTKLTPWKCPYQRLHYVLHALRGCWVTQLSPCECPPSRFLPCSRFERTPGNKVHSLAVPTLNVSIAFHMLWEDAGAENWFPGSAHIPCFYCIVHTLRGYWATKLIPWECPCSFSIVFCMLSEDAG